MNKLIDILEHTQYEAKGANEKWLMDELRKGLSREQAKAHWLESGKKPGHFRMVYKDLKDGILANLLAFPLGLKDIQAARAKAWRKMAESKILLIADKRSTAVEISAEAVRLAEKYGLAEIVLSLSKNLAYYYGVIKADEARAAKYRIKYKSALNDLVCEEKAHSILTEMAALVSKSKSVIHLMGPLKSIDEEGSNNLFFRIYFYTVWVSWHRIYNDVEGQLVMCGKAIRFFEKDKTAAPYSVHYTFRRQLALSHLANANYKLSERSLLDCLKYPKKGEHNWHTAQQLRCRVGFYSNKPRIVSDAINRAEQAGKNSLSPIIVELWEVVKAWQAVLSLGKGEKVSFKLARFLNSVPMCSKDKRGQNVQVLILEHLLLLFSGDKKRFMERSWTLPQYCSQYLRGKQYARGRCMLMILSRIDRERYKRHRVETAIAKWRIELAGHPLDVEREWIPFERVLDLILDSLS